MTDKSSTDMKMYNLTYIQKRELEAMILNKQSIIEVISALRKYRKVVKTLLSRRYTDGECDSAALSEFESDIEDIESGI
jgi:hypothetical protein